MYLGLGGGGGVVAITLSAVDMLAKVAASAASFRARSSRRFSDLICRLLVVIFEFMSWRDEITYLAHPVITS